MRKFLIGAAAIALAASAASADPGKGNGGGNKGGGGNDHAAMSHGGGKSDKGPKADKGPAMREAKADRGPDMRAERKADRASEVRAAKRDEKAVKDRIERVERRVERDVRSDRAGRDGRDRDQRIVRTDWTDRDRRGLIEGCPPGLDKKNNGCLPPGLAKKRDGWTTASYRPDWFGYSGLGDGRYRYDDGYLYRLGDNGSVLGFLPLLGGALSVGNPWPSYYDPTPVPDYYAQYFNLGSADGYRYADDVLYRVDPQTNVIDSIAALLTGDRFAIGQPLPMGYDVYNVPYGYQDQYYDTPEAMYRYSDGYVYQVDPTTQLVQAVIELLV